MNRPSREYEAVRVSAICHNVLFRLIYKGHLLVKDERGKTL